MPWEEITPQERTFKVHFGHALNWGVNLTLVSDEPLIRKEQGKNGNRDDSIKIHHCSQMVAMDELPLKGATT